MRDRLEHEKSSWDTILKSISTCVDSAAETSWKQTATGQASHFDPMLLDEPEQKDCLSMLTSTAQARTKSKERLVRSTDSVEYRIDCLADGVHKLEKLDECLDEATSRMLEDTTKALQKRGDEASDEGSVKAGANVRDLLRAFSRSGR